MVHYNTDWHATQAPPPVCPKCGSHRTNIVGRSDDGTNVVVRCNACGETSRIEVSDDSDCSEAGPSAIEAGAQR